MTDDTHTTLSGRERLHQMQEREALTKKRRRVVVIVASVITVLALVVAGMWGLSRYDNRSAEAKALDQAKDSSFIPTLTHVPASTFNAVGAGSTKAGAYADLPGSSPSKVDGKPRVMYVGAEFCPWCAMERWGFVAALSRFGEFKGLSGALSSGSEGDLSNIQTVTFRNATYTSKYVSLKTYETTDRDHKPLQTMSKDDEATFTKYSPNGSIPWISWGGTRSGGLNYDAEKLLVGKSNAQIAAALKDPNSEISRGVLGSANVASAQICRLTNNQPANVCTSPGVVAAAKNLS